MDNNQELSDMEFDLHPTLTKKQCWEHIFETQLPPESSTAYTLKEISMSLGSFVNIGVRVSTTNDERRLFTLTDPEINFNNVIPVPFLFGTEPNVFDFEFIHVNKPKSIRIIEGAKIIELETQLRNNNILSNNSELAGAILLLHKENTYIKPKKINLIALGVVEKDTNKPLVFVMCPEKMFEYKFTDGDDGPKRKRKVKEPVSMFAKQTSLVGVQL